MVAKPPWTYPSHVYKDNKFFVYELQG